MAQPETPGGLTWVWEGGFWAYAEDWSVRDGRLIRPGRLPVPASSVHALEVGADGRVYGWRREERIRWLREDGPLSGIQEGEHLRLAHPERQRREGGRLTGIGDSRFRYGAEGLDGVDWGGGWIGVSRVVTQGRLLESAIEGPGGAWRCRVEGESRLLESPEGRLQVRRELEGGPERGGVERNGRGTAGSGVMSGMQTWAISGSWTGRISLRDGMVIGWIDPRGAAVRVVREPGGRVIGVEGSQRSEGWGVEWSGERLAGLLRGDGARWRVEAGSVTDPAGRVRVRSQSGRERYGGWTVEREGGRVRSLTDGAGRTARLEREEGRVREIRLPAAVWRIGRDRDGEVVEITDPAGLRWGFVREQGRLLSLEEPGGRRWRIGWSGGRIASMETDGAAWGLHRDRAGRLVGVDTPLGRWSVDRDMAGRVTGLVWPGGRAAIQTDGAGAAVSVAGLGLARDGAGRPVRMQLPGGGSLQWRRDEAGRLAEVEAPGVEIGLRWDGAGGLVEVTRAGAAQALQRDGAGWLAGGQGMAGADGAGQAWTIQRDGAGRVTRLRGGLLAEGQRDLQILRGTWGEVQGFRLPPGADGVERSWQLHRDGAGRLLVMNTAEGRLGLGRDGAGRVSLVRGPWGLVPVTWSSAGAEWEGEDTQGRPLEPGGFSVDGAGRVIGVGGSWERRQTWEGLGLAAVGDGDQVWTWDRAGISGPEGRIGLEDGRASGWRRGPGERVEEGSAGLRLEWDGGGWLTGITERGELRRLRRDGLGRLIGVNGAAVEGWDRVILRGASEILHEPGAGWTDGRLGALYGSDGWELPVAGGAAWGDGGLVDPAGRLWVGSVRVGLARAVGPWGLGLGPEPIWPWAPGGLEPFASGQDSPVPGELPGEAPWWSPDCWGAQDSWGDLLVRLVELGELPQIPVIPPIQPGLPWLGPMALPAPAPLRAMEVPPIELPGVDPMVEALWRAIQPGQPGIGADRVAGWLLAEVAGVAWLPEVAPPLPGQEKKNCAVSIAGTEGIR